MLLSIINDYIKEKDYDKIELLIIFHDYTRIKNKMNNILNKIKSLFSDENKKEDFNKNIALLNDNIKDCQKKCNFECFCKNDFDFYNNYYDDHFFFYNKVDCFWENPQTLKSKLCNYNIFKLIHKIQPLYFNEIDSKIFKDYYYELIYLFFQMELIRKEIKKSELIRFLLQIETRNKFKEKKKETKLK